MKPDTIPYDLDAERAVLGSCLQDRDAFLVARNIVSADEFYLEKHSIVYLAISACVERRTPPDLVTVKAELVAQNKLEYIGGLLFLIELTNELPSAVHVEYYAKAVAEFASRRRTIELGGKISSLAYAGSSSQQIMREIKELIELEDRIAPKQAVNWEKKVVSARDLYAQDFPPMNYIIDTILPEGTLLLTGKPKTRKSWLAMNFCWSVAAGGKAIGHYQAARGDALYIDMEMGQRRMHKRLHVLARDELPPRGLTLSAEPWPRLGEGFEETFSAYMADNPYTKIVVVDTLIAIRPRRTGREDPYEADKSFAQALTDLAHEHRIAMILVHHSRKADGLDSTDDASGSVGLVGGVDNYAALRLDRNDTNLGLFAMVGRDIEFDDDIHMKWDALLAQWTKSEDQGPTLTPEREAVLGLLIDQPGLTFREVALLLRRDENGTKRLLSNMKKASLVDNTGGKYYPTEMAEGKFA